ncbi:fasciclin domain-containing protein [Saccharicrinis sp. FJH62]|uniref:fasciclin domain-containing protein n=1 Tax=Saccharicrinis sp. FJH62 TaxID=3344657 RepID=UPI0035D4926A
MKMRSYHIVTRGLFILTVFSLVLLYSCDSDKIGKESYYTFTGDLVGGYLSSHQDEFSEFVKLLDTTRVMGLLNAYGIYTCFAPDNDAMLDFYADKGKKSMADFSMDTLKKIVYDHIIQGFSLGTNDFIEGRLSQKTMSDRFIAVSYQSFSEGDLTIRINKTSPIIKPNIEVHNGMIHKIGEVLHPSEKTLVEALSEDKKFSLFFSALLATGLDKSLNKIEDKSYDPSRYSTNEDFTDVGSIIKIPQSRKYGYTALVESDSTYALYDIVSLDDLKAYSAQIYDQVYPEDAGISDVTDRKNSLNRFIAYHLINKQINYSKFIIDLDNTGHSIKTYDMFEYIETMCPNTLMEVRTNRATSEYNIFNMVESANDAIRIVPTNYDNDALNGVYHEIDKIMAYDFACASHISGKRLRMDAASFFPELTNNNLRGNLNKEGYPSVLWILPQGYIDRVTTSEGTEFAYYDFDQRFLDFQGDEVYLKGLYDFSITTPAIPAGTYEVRFGWKVETKRGAAQLYWDGIPCGIPLDLTIFANNPNIGYVRPGEDPSDPYGYENDKMMRNRGYMKGPASFQPALNTWFAGNARINDGYLRRILGIYTFDEAGTHTFSVKAARTGEFMFDFLEFVPVEVLESEGID